MQITGAELFVKALLEEKVDTLFAYPGGQVIDLFDALYDVKGIEMIIPRHEQGLVHAADGYARSTGKVGVCLVTSGPGATNLVTGIATANYDSVPLVCFTGQVSTSLMGKEAFQEVDIVAITKSICKYAVTVEKRQDLGAVIKKAFYIAQSGKPGVVVVDLPKDIQQALGSDVYPETVEDIASEPNTQIPLESESTKTSKIITKLSSESDTQIFRKTMKKIEDCLKKAKRPVFLLGGGVNISHAHKEMTALAEKTGIPVVTTIMGKGAIPTNHPLYVGNLGIHGSYAANRAVSECDVLCSIGVRFNDRITGKVSEFATKAIIIHMDIEPAVISRNIKADIPLVADARQAITSLLKTVPVLDFTEWRTQIGEWKRQNPLEIPQQSQTGVTPLFIIKTINKIFPKGIITTDVGQNQLWTTQFLELNNEKKMLTSGGLGTMGYGLPAAIGAKLGNPDKEVLTICGDGGIQMNIQELATAVVYELPITICIFNNGYLGNVRQWQEMFYHKRYSGTCMRYRKSCASACNMPFACCPEYTPDFIKLAESYGAKAIRVEKYEEIEGALLEAKNTKKVPTVIEFIIEREENVFPIVPPGNPLNHMIFKDAWK